MNEILSVIQSKFTADSTLAPITQGLFVDVAPEGTVMPYAVYSILPGGTTQASFGAILLDLPLVQISIYQTGATACAQLADLVAASFNGGSTITVNSTNYAISFVRCYPVPLLFDSFDQNSNPVYHAPLTFRTTVQLR